MWFHAACSSRTQWRSWLCGWADGNVQPVTALHPTAHCGCCRLFCKHINMIYYFTDRLLQNINPLTLIELKAYGPGILGLKLEMRHGPRRWSQWAKSFCATDWQRVSTGSFIDYNAPPSPLKLCILSSSPFVSSARKRSGLTQIAFGADLWYSNSGKKFLWKLSKFLVRTYK